MQTTELGAIATIKTGKLDANASIEGGQYPFFTCSKTSLRIDSYSFDGEYVLVAGNGDLNVKHYSGKFDAYQRTYAIKANEKMLSSRYLFYFLSKYVEVLRDLAIGGVIKYIKLNNLTDAKIPLPPLIKQQKIVSILDAADSLRQKDQQLIKKYTALSQSLFLEMFGDPVSNPMRWNTDKFSNIAVNCDSVRIPIKQSEREKIQGEYPYYGATGIVDYVNDYIFDGEFLLIAEDGKNLVNRKKPLAWVVSGKFWVNNHSHIVKSNGSTNLTFLEFHFNNMDISNYVTGIDQFKMNKSNLDRIQIILPPITLQNQFAELIQSIEAQKQLAQASLKKSDDLFNSLLQRAFKGELTT